MRIDDTKFDIALANSRLTIGQAAARAGISRQRFYTILNQKRVTPQAAGKIARSLGVEVTEIIQDEGDGMELKIPTMVTLAEASKQTGLSYDYLRKLCLTGQITHTRAGKKYLINLEKLVDYLNGGTADA